MANHLRTDLVVDALDLAVAHRQPGRASFATRITAAKTPVSPLGIVASRGSRSDCYDNALLESFCATLACDLRDGRAFPTHRMARTALFDILEGFDNAKRRHSVLGWYSLMEYGRSWTTTDQVA